MSVIRTEIGLTGTKEGCDDCECGACMVLVDGRPVNSCSYLAVQTDGREVTTVEGLGTTDEPHPLQRNIVAEGGVQCGFCTPGMLISATALLAASPQPSEDEIRIALGGNLCRCTGYQKIVRAVQRTADELASRADLRGGAARSLPDRCPSAPTIRRARAHERHAVPAADLDGHDERSPRASAGICQRARRDVAGDVAAALQALAREPRAAARRRAPRSRRARARMTGARCTACRRAAWRP